MRRLHRTLAYFGIVAAGAMGQLTACSDDANNCEANYEQCTTSSGSSSSSGVIAPPGCEKLPSESNEVIRDDCAYFVGGANASDSNAGGEATPLATLSKALGLAGMTKGRVYLCGNFAERVEVPSGVSVFGGFNCDAAEWVYDSTVRATIAPDAPDADAEFQASVRIAAGTTRIEDVNIEAKNATIDGGSSIAVIVDKATVTFSRVDLKAGDGKDGVKGATPADDVGSNDPNDASIKGNDGQIACSGGTTGNPGGVAKTNALCAESIGGKGGRGWDVSDGEAGDDGMPTDATFGQGSDPVSVQCLVNGGPGLNGADGASGAGGTEAGAINATGYAGTSGAAGGKGKVGQGGGGGGGAKGATDCNGASGGGGGAGGCPGSGGLGGTAGGSSIGIANVLGTLTFSSVKIATGVGGNGGAGGTGQDGGVGGAGGKGGTGKKLPGNIDVAAGCNGGDGGTGGSGGQGGGGHGGHSVGIAYKTGTTGANVTTGADIKPGTAGNGGSGADMAGAGSSGTAAATLELN